MIFQKKNFKDNLRCWSDLELFNEPVVSCKQNIPLKPGVNRGANSHPVRLINPKAILRQVDLYAPVNFAPNKGRSRNQMMGGVPALSPIDSAG